MCGSARARSCRRGIGASLVVVEVVALRGSIGIDGDTVRNTLKVLLGSFEVALRCRCSDQLGPNLLAGAVDKEMLQGAMVVARTVGQLVEGC